MIRRVVALLVAALLTAALAGCAKPLGYPGYTGSAAAAASAADRAAHAKLPVRTAGYLGVYDQDTPTSYRHVDSFARAVGRQPNIVLYYTTWGGGFQRSLAQMALAHGATLAMDLDPTTVTVSSIARGRQDKYLRYFAESVRAFGRPVIISFGHEMNGNWYSWGWTHTAPSVWVRAWRHIVTLFRKNGADNVTWLWTVNGITAGQAPIRDWWPGARYVTWTGIDAYYYYPSQDFANTFGPTIGAIRAITKKPILIAETAIGQVAGQAAKIPGLLAGLRAYHVLGFVWFDVAQNSGIYHQAWRLEGDESAIAAFRQAAKRYLKLIRPAGSLLAN
jgi:mannan endo-1,4-beta-mannosidase